MISKIEVGPAAHQELFAEPTPLGLIGLALGCAALTPVAFGFRLTPAGLATAAVVCLLFGAGCQFLAGLMTFANRNLYGGTLFTVFALNWTFNWWVLNSLAQEFVPDAVVILAVEAASLVVFLAITYGFGFYSTLLFAFLAELGGLVLTPRPEEPAAPAGVRLTAAGIDFFEQVVLKKDQFA